MTFGERQRGLCQAARGVRIRRAVCLPASQHDHSGDAGEPGIVWRRLICHIPDKIDIGRGTPRVPQRHSIAGPETSLEQMAKRPPNLTGGPQDHRAEHVHGLTVWHGKDLFIAPARS